MHTLQSSNFYPFLHLWYSTCVGLWQSYENVVTVWLKRLGQGDRKIEYITMRHVLHYINEGLLKYFFFILSGGILFSTENKTCHTIHTLMCQPFVLLLPLLYHNPCQLPHVIFRWFPSYGLIKNTSLLFSFDQVLFCILSRKKMVIILLITNSYIAYFHCH